jgi:predicted Ser/Thr protein kinase
LDSGRHSRIIGMALLQGQVTYQALEAASRKLRGRPGEFQEEQILLELWRLGQITDVTLEALNRQVEDLERFMADTLGEINPNSTVAAIAQGQTPSIHEAPPEPESENDRTTTARALWATVPDGSPSAGDNRSILSVLNLPRWNHYADLHFIGEGGMGRIFRAFDTSLRRQVALKFLRREDRDLVRRLFLEAQHQAQVDHPNICKVYEVSEWHGQVYVAMQFIDGETLSDMTATLNLEQKVRIMEIVAEAVHAAHRLGLVHRDLKPANIMVETGEDGVLKPYVLDFGLARDVADTGETMEGSILGTFHYMAPEQARGDLAKIERRTDVWALGASLYEMLSGNPPFAETKGLDCLHRILDEDIPNIRRVVPEVPKDLETIVMKCLEKTTERRYESARALAEDLSRFLDGEPILARPATFTYRLGKLAKKNKIVVSMMGAALVVVLVFAGVGIQARVTAANRARWAQYYGQEAERIEALLRYSRLQPTHDIRLELKIVQTRIQAMEEAVRQGRSGALGPGNYALGRAYLALGDPDRAKNHLEKAWEDGFQEKSAAYARGRVLGLLFSRGLQQARNIQNRELREAKVQELEQSLRDPAAELLKQGQGSLLDPPAFQEGLLAFYGGQHREAIAKAREAAQTAPWFYEARRLEAEISMDQSRREKDPAKALSYLEAANSALLEALRTAPSDPDLCDLESRRWWDEMTLRRQAVQPLREAFDALQKACQRWTLIRPDLADADARRAWADLEMARDATIGDKKARLIRVESGRKFAETALHQKPDHPEALGALAAVLTLHAYTSIDRNQDLRPVLDRAIGLLNKAMESAPEAYELCDQLAMAYWARLEYEKTAGVDPSQTLKEATQAMGRIASRFPRVADFEAYLGGFYVEKADFEAIHGIDPGPSVEGASARLGQAIRLMPRRYDFHYSLGNAYLTRAHYLLFHAGDPMADLDLAEKAYLEARALNPKNAGVVLGLTETQVIRAWALVQRKESPVAEFSKAERLLQESASMRAPSWREAYYQSELELLRSRWLKEPQQVRALLLASERHVAQALQKADRQPAVLWLAAVLELEWAKRFPEDAIHRKQAAQLYLQKALKLDPGFIMARRTLEETTGQKE